VLVRAPRARRLRPSHKDSRSLAKKRRTTVLGTVLIIILILLLIGGLPVFPYSRKWGYGPGGVVGVILVIVVILLLMGYLR